ncbi:hypothetical protein SLS60_003881 [Paraconiothyrium brasiliense]|uniref:Uncharacterized protein n=1 Tax=Paraconiothyrium brasiliense TaxID=300254 RepID=A0ABR3RRE3_9PLEO
MWRVDGAVEMMNNRMEAQKRGAEMQRLEARFWGGYVRVGEVVLAPEPEWEKELRGDLSQEGFEAFLESEGQELDGEPRVEYSGEDFAAFLES